MEQTTTKLIKTSDLLENPLNLRSMNEIQIDVIANCIKRDGLLTPLLAYKKGDKYVLLSGHKRLRALQKIGAEYAEVSVREKPRSDIHEQELLAQANIHRSAPEEIIDEVLKGENRYNTMDKSERKEWSKLLKEYFISISEGNPKYQEDPRNYIANNFKPKSEYIRATTGLDISNSTVKRILKECQAEDEDISEEELPFSEEKETKKEKKITRKNVLKAVDTLYGLLQIYECEDIDEVLRADAYIQMKNVEKELVDLQLALGEK